MKFVLLAGFLFCGYISHAQTDASSATKSDSAVYFNPEISPAYPGGDAAWARYLKQNWAYPDKAIQQGIEGVVEVQFMVDSNGKARNVTALSGPVELRDESVRLINHVKAWVPAINNGRKVNAWQRKEIEFVLSSK